MGSDLGGWSGWQRAGQGGVPLAQPCATRSGNMDRALGERSGEGTLSGSEAGLTLNTILLRIPSRFK